MEYTVIDHIVKREKNTRYLLQGSDGEYYSIKVNSGRFEIGDSFSEMIGLRPEIAETRWIRKIERYPRQKLMDHLKWYKQECLKDNVNGTFRSKPHPHIFDKPEKNLLLIGDYDDALQKQMNGLGTELRSDFSHLTSSQAFAVNFFSPLIAEKKLRIIDPCFDFVLPECKFEKILDDEESTQFDFYAIDNEGKRSCSVEVKYSESGFGSTIGDATHLDKFLNDYESKMRTLTDVPQDNWQFFEYYQVWRNLLYTLRNPGQHICFLFPAFRSDLKQTIEIIIGKCKEEYHPFFHIIYADDVVNSIIKSNSPMRHFYEEFKKKYLDIDILQ
jgi:hypothetical protein